MSLYSYKAVAPDGRKVLGRIDALNVIDLEMRLRRMELDLISGETVSNQSLFGSGSVPRRELIHFCFHLELLVRAGVPILEGLSDLRDTWKTRAFAKSSPASSNRSRAARNCRRPWKASPKYSRKSLSA